MYCFTPLMTAVVTAEPGASSGSHRWVAGAKHYGHIVLLFPGRQYGAIL